MSGLHVRTVVGLVFLSCDRCWKRWESKEYRDATLWSGAEAAAPAFEEGWRVYAGKRSQRTYCPSCSPTVPMTQIYPRKEKS